MNFQQIKTLFNDEWINKMCDELTYSGNRSNNIRMLESLHHVIGNSFNTSSLQKFEQQREAYLFVSDCIEKELEANCYAV